MHHAPAWLDWARGWIPTWMKHFAVRCGAFIEWKPFQVASFAQEGEDIVLTRLFDTQAVGFYVDVGAHHPYRFSNTYLFYSRGWRGINIDAMPGGMEQFIRFRPRDVNLEMAVMSQPTRMTYYEFNEPALNGFSKELSASRHGLGNYKIVRTTEMEGKRLGEILAEHVPVGTRIDFLSIDVEGLDLDVLESNDWSRFRPKAVLVEMLGTSLGTIQTDPIFKFLEGNRYHIYAKAVNTAFFLSEEYLAMGELGVAKPTSRAEFQNR